MVLNVGKDKDVGISDDIVKAMKIFVLWSTFFFLIKLSEFELKFKIQILKTKNWVI